MKDKAAASHRVKQRLLNSIQFVSEADRLVGPDHVAGSDLRLGPHGGFSFGARF